MHLEDRPASDLALIRKHALDFWELNTGYSPVGIACRASTTKNLQQKHSPQQSNDWQIEHWLNPEPRLRASLIVPSQNPELAAREIERLGGQPGFVQIMLPVTITMHLYGNIRYYPIYAAAVRLQLVVEESGLRPRTRDAPTSVGWPSSYLEEYVGMSPVLQAQVLSLVSEGVFDKFPDLRIALS